MWNKKKGVLSVWLDVDSELGLSVNKHCKEQTQQKIQMKTTKDVDNAFSSSITILSQMYRGTMFWGKNSTKFHRWTIAFFYTYINNVCKNIWLLVFATQDRNFMTILKKWEKWWLCEILENEHHAYIEHPYPQVRLVLMGMQQSGQQDQLLLLWHSLQLSQMKWVQKLLNLHKWIVVIYIESMS